MHHYSLDNNFVFPLVLKNTGLVLDVRQIVEQLNSEIKSVQLTYL